MAEMNNSQEQTLPERHIKPHFCSIIPPNLLLSILQNSEVSETTRAAVEKTYNHTCKLKSHRSIRQAEIRAPVQGLAAPTAPSAGRSRSIIPNYMFQAMANREDASEEDKDRAKKESETGQGIRAKRSARTATDTGVEASSAAAGMVRKIYDSQKTSKLRKTLLFQEGAAATTVKDQNAKEVLDFFGKTYQFYKEVFDRESVDDSNLALIGSVHYDDIPGPPGMDNAFWDGDEMAFGDGDGDIFGSFTKNLDVIGHELTHGVVQYTANLEYEFQSGALNESMADVFGTMIKQYFHSGGKQLAADADWLIGEGIFLPSVTGAKALRSMKAPGTAYNNPKIGKDPQPADMDGYQDLPNTDNGDSGGVHINSGIPNHAFYLASIELEGYSWEKAGKIWYAALQDDKLKNIDTKEAFVIFADLTTQYAKSLFDDDVAAKVKKAWTDVKVYKAGATPNEPKDDL